MDELEEHTTFETDDNFDQFVSVNNTPKKRKKKKKGKKKKSEPEADL